MNIILEKIILEKLLINTQSYIEKKDLSQITSHIHIQAINNKIQIQATDYEIGIQISTNKINIKEEGFSIGEVIIIFNIFSDPTK